LSWDGVTVDRTVHQALAEHPSGAIISSTNKGKPNVLRHVLRS
jgi:hypothetical protein